MKVDYNNLDFAISYAVINKSYEVEIMNDHRVMELKSGIGKIVDQFKREEELLIKIRKTEDEHELLSFIDELKSINIVSARIGLLWIKFNQGKETYNKVIELYKQLN